MNGGIRATVVDGGKTGLTAILFGVQNNNMNDMNVVNDIVGAPLLNNTSAFFNTSMVGLNNIYRSNETINMSKNILMHHGAVFNNQSMNIITMNNIHVANDRMRNIIASHPEVIRLDALGYIDGFSNTIPDTDLVHLVTDTELREEDGVGMYNTYSHSEYDDMYDDLDRYIIKSSWDTVSDLLDRGLDPTSDELRPF